MSVVELDRRGRPSFDWFEDAVDAAVALGEQTGVKHRVYYAGLSPRPWRVAPATLRAVPGILVHVPEVCS